jgi:hypothetical protein
MPPRTVEETLQEARYCAKCHTLARIVEEAIDDCYSQGECLLISCACRQIWCYCKSCKKRFKSNNLMDHPATKKHKKNHLLLYPPAATATSGTNATNDATTDGAAIEAFPGTEFHDPASTGNMAPNDQMDLELTETYINNAESSMLESSTGAVTHVADGLSPFPKINMEGNEWLHQLLKDSKPATVAELHNAFTDPQIAGMKNYWLAELGSGYGRCGGGLVYLVAKAFQQVRDAQLDKTRFPSFAEAQFQLDNLLQYQSMNEKQRLRHSRITKTIMDHVPSGAFFKETLIPNYNQLGRYYGMTGQHSLWQNLPIPKAVDVGGVAYVSPKAIIAFMMANGVPMDDIVIVSPLSDGMQESEDPSSIPVLHVQDSRKARAFMKDVMDKYYRSNPGAPKYPFVVIIYLVDWKDGFGPSKVKNNRGSVDVKTFTISPPKAMVNGTANMCDVAIGLKTAKGWNQVEHMFNKDLQDLTSSPVPQLFFHGATQKMVPVFAFRACSLADKVEKAVVTGTISYGGDVHRTYGFLGVIKTPSCKVHEIEAFLRAEEVRPWGWSFPFVNHDANGAKFPACRKCRRDGLLQLGVLNNSTNQPEAGRKCAECANWDLMRTYNEEEEVKAVLDFPKHKDYPKRIVEGSPVEPPPGRDVFEENDDGRLPFVKLDWSMMIQACKFAFFQASRPRKKQAGIWTQANTTCYLKYCGVNPKLAKVLAGLAQSCAKAKEQADIDYEAPDGIGGFDFPAAWQSDLMVPDFIEAVMHLINLGVQESNFDLITKWLTDVPARSKLSSQAFRNAIQPLLKDLKVFMLAWLAAYPLTGEQLKTGGWVSENWMTMIRLSKVLFAWCAQNHELAAKFGVDDLSRMVIAFNAMVARALTHSSIDDAFVAEMELYMLEFLSCVREFDIRIRYNKLGKSVTKFSERKGTEAWWLKSNYMCLPNLLAMMLLLGPLVLWWDGGGKGERFIQSVKPHIKRGIREDVLSFFVRLLEKLFKVQQSGMLEKRYCGNDDLLGNNSEEDLATIMDILNEVADALSIPDDESDGQDYSTSAGGVDDAGDISGSDDDEEEGHGRPWNDASHFSEMEEHGMTKTKTIYVYRNEKHLNDAVAASKPLAGFVVVKTTDRGDTNFEFQIVYRKPVKQFARLKVVFNDGDGIAFHGLWWAGIEVEQDEIVQSTDDFSDVQADAKLSAVAIPLCYVIGHEKANSKKYCVITNWWKERMCDGSYRLPTLDPALYRTAGEDLQDDDDQFSAWANPVNAQFAAATDQDTNQGNNTL